MSNNEVPLFAHLNYKVLHDLDISINEYFLLDMIFHLSGNGSRWCNKKLENIAFDMRLSVSGVRKLRDRLIEKKLLLKGIGNRLRTSEKVYKVYFFDERELRKTTQSAQKSALSASKSVQKVTKTPVENNYRITREKKDNIYPQAQAQNPIVDGPGRAFALKKLEEIKRRSLDKMKPSYHA